MSRFCLVGMLCLACNWGSQSEPSNSVETASASRSLNQSCAKPSDCETGLTCVKFRCADPFEDERRKCAHSEMCAQSGHCDYLGGRCVARIARHCQLSRDCSINGLCALKGNQCVAADTKACQRSEACAEKQRCFLRGEQCVWRPKPGSYLPISTRDGGRLYVSKTEVTQDEFARVLKTRPSYHKDCGDQCPVERVSLRAVFDYANQLSQKAGLMQCYEKRGVRLRDCTGFRLPTESEWQWFAFDAPHLPILFVPWTKENSDFESKPVCSAGLQRFGLCDLLGNVWEWVHSDESLSESRHKLTPKGVVRGGSFAFRRRFANAPSRWEEDSGEGGMTVGFRLLTASELE